MNIKLNLNEIKSGWFNFDIIIFDQNFFYRFDISYLSDFPKDLIESVLKLSSEEIVFFEGDSEPVIYKFQLTKHSNQLLHFKIINLLENESIILFDGYIDFKEFILSVIDFYNEIYTKYVKINKYEKEWGNNNYPFPKKQLETLFEMKF